MGRVLELSHHSRSNQFCARSKLKVELWCWLRQNILRSVIKQKHAENLVQKQVSDKSFAQINLELCFMMWKTIVLQFKSRRPLNNCFQVILLKDTSLLKRFHGLCVNDVNENFKLSTKSQSKCTQNYFFQQIYNLKGKAC